MRINPLDQAKRASETSKIEDTLDKTRSNEQSPAAFGVAKASQDNVQYSIEDEAKKNKIDKSATV